MTGPELRDLRAKLGLEQVSLAYLVGCYQHHISRWESGTVTMGRKWHDRFTWLAEHAHEPDWQVKIAEAILATY